MYLSTSHNPGTESRETELKVEWKLNRTVSHNKIGYIQYYPVIDLFESRLNIQIKRLFSYRTDPSKSNKSFTQYHGKLKHFVVHLPYV